MADKVLSKRAIKKQNNNGGKVDVVFLSLVLILLTIGLIMLFSASYAYSLERYGNSYRFISRQALLGGVGLVIMFLVSRIDYHYFRKWAWVIFAVTIAVLIFLLAMQNRLMLLFEDSMVRSILLRAIMTINSLRIEVLTTLCLGL